MDGKTKKREVDGKDTSVKIYPQADHGESLVVHEDEDTITS